VQFLSIPIYILEAMLRLNVRNLLVWSVLVFAEIQPEAIYSWFLRLKNRLPEKWPPPTTIVAIATLAGIVIAVVVLTQLRGRSEYHKQVSVKNRTRLSAMAYNAGKVDVAVQTLTREATRLVGWLLHDELETALQLENDNQPSDHPGEYLNRRGFGGYSMESTSFDWSREHPLRDHSLSAFKYGRRDLLSPCLASLDKLREPLSAAQEDGVYASLLSVAPKRLRDALLDIDWQSEWVSRLRSLEAESVGDLFKNAVRSASTSDIPSGEPNESGLALEHAWRDFSDEFRERLSDVMYISQQLQGLSSGLRKLNRPSVTQRLVSVVGPK
jgi:hypothetical protein